MADQSIPIKNVAFDLYFQIFKSDGTIIANPGGLAGRTVNTTDTTGAATDNSPSVVDSTGGWCKLTLSQAEMNSDYVGVTVTSTDSDAVSFSAVIYPAAAALATASALATVDGLVDDLTTAVAALPDDTDIAALDALLDAIKLKTDLISAGTISVLAATHTTGEWGPLVAGDDYVAGTVNELSVTTDLPLDTLGAGGVTLNIGSITGVVCTVAETDGSYSVTVPHLTAAQTGMLGYGVHTREFEALDTDGFKTTFGRSSVSVLAD